MNPQFMCYCCLWFRDKHKNKTSKNIKKTWCDIKKNHKEEVPVSFHLVTKIQIMYNTSTCLFGVQYSNILLCTNYESTHLLPDSAKASLYPLMLVSIDLTKYDKSLHFHLYYSIVTIFGFIHISGPFLDPSFSWHYADIFSSYTVFPLFRTQKIRLIFY